MAAEPLRDRLEASPVIGWLKDLDGRYVYVNRGYVEQLDAVAERILGHLDAELLPREAIDGPRLQDGDDLDDEPIQLEYRVAAYEGRPALAVLRFAVCDGDGAPVYVCGVAAPIEQAQLARAECSQLMQLETGDPNGGADVELAHERSRAAELEEALDRERARTKEAELEGARQRARAEQAELALRGARAREDGAVQEEQVRTRAAEAEAAGARSAAERMHAQLAEATGARDRLEAQLAEATGARDRLEAQLAEATGARDRLEAQLAEATEGRERLESERESMGAALAQARLYVVRAHLSGA
jgi:hypothetical protein